MLPAIVWSLLLSREKTIVKMAPVVRCGVGWFNAERFNGINRLKDALHLRPAADAQEDLAARRNARQRLIRITTRDRTHDVDAGEDCAEVVGRPAHECEHAVGRECEDALPPVDDGFAAAAPEADPTLGTAFEPGQFDLR